jgi:dihydroorotate dehydrogenase electron transfer subunit
VKQVIATVISNVEVMLGTRLVWLESPQIATAARPGQFVMVRCAEALLRRPLSIHQVEGGRFALLFTVVGRGTGWLSQRQTGDTVDIFGPLGNGYTIFPDSKNMLLVAGGIGIAPLSFLAQQASNQGCYIKLLIGGRTAAQLYPSDLIADGVDTIYTTEDATIGRPRRVTVLVPDYFDWADQIFACGPLPMYRNLAENFPQLKNKPVQVSLEIVMGCGAGVCYGCTIKTRSGLKQVCQDGPVFDLEDIIWEGMRGV